MKKYRYLDNAFWEAPDRSILKCIKMTELNDGKSKKEVLTLKKFVNGTEINHQFQEVVSILGIKTIDDYTKKREEEKKKKHHEEALKQEQKNQAKQLEGLFGAKLRAFEIELVKNSTNKTLRTKLRRAQNEMELNALVTLIIGEELGLFGNKND